jgi:hypothetical protein
VLHNRINEMRRRIRRWPSQRRKISLYLSLRKTKALVGHMFARRTTRLAASDVHTLLMLYASISGRLKRPIIRRASRKSKRGNTNVQRRALCKVAKLELQPLSVLKPKGATDDNTPKSVNSCIREMKEAELAVARNWEGRLT